MAGRKFVWHAFNQTYGPWYEMKEVKAAISVDLKHKGHVVTAIVQPDMDKGAWYWSVKFHAYKPKPAHSDDNKELKRKPKVPLPERRYGGKSQTLKTAMAKAEEVFLTGRPTMPRGDEL